MPTRLSAATSSGAVPVNGYIELIESNRALISRVSGEVYLKTGVVETTVATYPNANVSAGFVDSVEIIANEPPDTANTDGVGFDGTYLQLINNTSDQTYAYLPDGTYTAAGNISFTDGSVEPANDIVFDGTNYYLLREDGFVYQYNSSGTYTGTSFNVSATTGNSCQGIEWDGTSFWIINSSTNVFRFTPSFVFDNFSLDINAQEHFVTNTQGSVIAEGIVFLSDTFYVMINDISYLFDTSWVYLGKSTIDYELGGISSFGFTGLASDSTYLYSYSASSTSIKRTLIQDFVGDAVTSSATGGQAQLYVRIN